jgi:hypothetical protein
VGTAGGGREKERVIGGEYNQSTFYTYLCMKIA